MFRVLLKKRCGVMEALGRGGLEGGVVAEPLRLWPGDGTYMLEGIRVSMSAQICVV